MSDLPKVSVVILAHRRDKEGRAMLARAIDSVHAQSYPNVELLVKDHPDYWPEKFNEASAGASGKYLVPALPYDDYLEPEFCARHVEELERARADLAYSDVYTIEQGIKFKFHLPAFDAEQLRLRCVPWMTFMVRTEFWRSLPNGTNGTVGGWDGNQRHPDWDAAIRMYQAHAKCVHLVGEFLWHRTKHPQAASMTMTTAEFDDALRQPRDKHDVMAHQ